LNSKSLSVSFETESGDIGLKLNPNFKTLKLQRSSSIKCKHEYKNDIGRFPFELSSKFEIFITVEEWRFKIIINRLNVYYFTHRIPLSEIKALKIESCSEIKISKLHFIEGFKNKILEISSEPLPFVHRIPISEGCVFRMLIDLPKNCEKFDVVFFLFHLFSK
jgi:hypothetical protein